MLQIQLVEICQTYPHWSAGGGAAPCMITPFSDPFTPFSDPLAPFSGRLRRFVNWLLVAQKCIDMYRDL
eukprot:11510543-Heterocapsa_arctica.AAC.1